MEQIRFRRMLPTKPHPRTTVRRAEQGRNGIPSGLPENVWYVFAYLLGFYILLRAFDFRQYLAVLGSVVWAFSSYFFIIIAADIFGRSWHWPSSTHDRGLVLAYRGKYLWDLSSRPSSPPLR
jgi:hypothetical protein